MQHLEVSCAVRPIEWPLGVKWLIQYAYCIKYPLLCTQPDYGQLRAETCCCYSFSTYAI